MKEIGNIIIQGTGYRVNDLNMCYDKIIINEGITVPRVAATAPERPSVR